MSQFLRGLFGWTLFLTVALPVRADDANAAKAIVDKAIKASGSEEKLSKLRAATIKIKGTVHHLDMDIPFTGEIITQGPDQSRVVIQAKINAQNFTITEVLNRDKGWKKDDNGTQDMTADELKEAQEGANESWVATLVPLKDKAYTLSTLGETKVGDRPALGVRVSSKGRRDVNLYFDKDTNLLVKSEMRVKDDQAKMEMNQETFFTDYKDVGGVKEAMKFSIKRDGQPYLDAEIEDIRRQEKVEDSLFTKP
jgi:hypothetical protein